uniref:hypothetical protein n=2 Tax=Klebsiella pneumoniae TaxID=573 RepID=UPI001CDADC95
QSLIKQQLNRNYKSNFKGVGVTKKIESEVIKRLQALNPETVRLDEMNRVVTLIGWTLSEKLPDTYSDENKGKDIEHDSDSLGISRVTRNGCCNPTEAVVLEHFLVGVVNPLTNAPKKDAKGNQCCRARRICRKNSSTVQQKNECTSDNQNFVPVVQSQFRQRVIHLIHRLFRGLRK